MTTHRAIHLAIAVLALGIVGFATLRATAQPYPQSPAQGATRLVGKHVTIYLNNSAAASTSRTRDSSGTDPFIRINDVPVSIAGTVSALSSEAGAHWIVLTRRESGEAWIPVNSVQLIEVSSERR